MPELPDLVHIEKVLSESLTGRAITGVSVREPVVLRVAVPEGFAAALTGRTLERLRRRGPFLVLELPPLELVVHFMLAGRFRLRTGAPRAGRELCFSLSFSDGRELEYLDDKRMGKVYLVRRGSYVAIPGFLSQGIDVLSEAFSEQSLRRLASGRRQQVRVFLMDQSALSAIGNAYADEILFDARLHPKTACRQLTDEEVGEADPEGAGPGQREGSLPVPNGPEANTPIRKRREGFGRQSMVWQIRRPSRWPATPPGTYRQRGTTSLQRLFRTHFPEFCARYDSDYARRLGHSRLQRITRDVERFLECGDYTKGCAVTD